MLEKSPNLGVSNRFPGGENTRDSIVNTSDSTHSAKFKNLSGRVFWGQKKLFDEKPETKKSRDAVS
jgi:hypothetical protein